MSEDKKQSVSRKELKDLEARVTALKKQCVSRKEFEVLEARVAELERRHRPDVVKRSPLPKDQVVKRRKNQQKRRKVPR
jgi:hypothetical protein